MQANSLVAHLDHLVVTAPSLAVGKAYIKHNLGVEMQPGGEHPRMGTHNCLLKLGERCYLEVIAVNPNAPVPERPRWFGLDDPIPADKVKLTTWIARSSDIRQAAANSPVALGDIEAMSRGRLRWQITIPADGSLPLQGIAPSLIQWSDTNHPAAGLPDSDCELLDLALYHPQNEQLAAYLQAIGYADDVSVERLATAQQPYLRATIKTPSGERQL